MASLPLIRTQETGTQVPGSLSDSPDLCETCRAIPFHIIFNTISNAGPSNGFVKVADVGTYYSAPPLTPCPLCRMLYALVDIPDAQATECDLWAIHPHLGYHRFKSGFASKYGPSNGNSICICLVTVDDMDGDAWYDLGGESVVRGIISEKGAVFCELRQPFGDPAIGTALTLRPIDTCRFDDRAVRELVQHCKEHHDLSCNSKPQHLPGFTVLDCETNPVSRLRPEASIPYLALSYVWGSVASPASFSPVVMDAITVTRRLGYRYLWVDQYCIDQTDEIHKMSQISHMDAIYHNADITIIASASQNQQDGLPGVSYPRTPNPYPPIFMGSFKFTKTFPDPGNEIRKSKWATRGWTFQEAVLSRRRLFFMKNQVYYECSHMNQEESVKLHHSNFEKRVHDELKENIYGVHFGSDGRTGLPISRSEELLVQYMSRDLTFPDDAFNAFKGVWSRLEIIDGRLRHVCGLPHILDGQMDIQSTNWKHGGYPRDSGYKTEENFWRSLSWYHTKEAVRRTQFPSWSWLGWAGHIAFSCLDPGSPRPYSKAKVLFQRKNTRTGVLEPEMLALDKVLYHSQDAGEVSLVMHLKTNYLPEEAQFYEEDGQLCCRMHEYEGKVQLSLREPFAETERKFRTGEYRAVLLRSTDWTDELVTHEPLHWDDEVCGHSLWFIVLHQKQSASYERIGTLSLQQMWLWVNDYPELRGFHKVQARMFRCLRRSRFVIV